MKFTLSWLKKHLETDATLDSIVNTMIKVGLEVEEVNNPADALKTISVGHITAAEKHPDADKLQVCKVSTKDGEMQIVCGAPNARKGIKVAYAPVGAYIAGIDVTLTKAKIRGVESFGMMCSTKELELGEDHDGIMELPETVAVGTPLAEVLDINDPVIDFEVTPNRPDTNGVLGIARDLAAEGLGTLITSNPASVPGSFPSPIAIEIDSLSACPAFAGRVIRGVKNGPSPQWLQDQLRAIGLRPINALVDITNYISYDRARPLHVYDIAKLTGPIRARMGRTGETFAALDGKEYTVDETICVIADDARVLGMGGVIGGEYSGCAEETTDVLVESALFDALLIARTGRKTGIISDARYRFERGVDPKSVLPGIEIATQMILNMCGGEPSETSLIGNIPDTKQSIEFPASDVERLTGMEITDSEKERILTALGFDVKRGGTWSVSVPSFRPDINGKADLVEEIARIHGMDNLPNMPLPTIPGTTRPQPSALQRRISAMRTAVTALGYHEAITWAFCEGDVAGMFGGNTSLHLSNPIASDLDVMRPSALPNLLLAIGRNRARGAMSVHLCEVGGRYETDAPDGQRTVLTIVSYGQPHPTWDGVTETADVFSAKRVALAALEAAGVITGNLMTLATGPDHFHPGRKGQFGLGPKNILASFGEIHPGILQKLDLPGPIAAAEIVIDAIPPAKSKTRTKTPLKASNLMPLTRSFAFVVDDNTHAEALVKAVRGADKALITDVRLFDIYRGENVGADKKSLAVDVTIQPTTKTLTDEDIESISKRIVVQAQKAVGAQLRV